MTYPAGNMDSRAEEIMEVLIAISVVSKRLAAKIAKLENKAKKGENTTHERNE